MSLKPPKKSDLDKGWMKKRLDREIRIQPEYHLIVFGRNKYGATVFSGDERCH